MHPFEKVLSVTIEEISLTLKDFPELPFADFLLNPRRLRGSDFLMRWSQGVWSEHRLIDAVNETEKYFAIPYGPSGTAPTDDARAFELYFERLEAAGLGDVKRPDIMVFRKQDRGKVDEILHDLGGVEELPFIEEGKLGSLLEKAVVSVESENSLWKAKKMPSYGAELRPMRRLGGKLGLPKASVLPTIILKEEDLCPLRKWQEANKIPIHIWHVFYDAAFGISLDEADRTIGEGFIDPTIQTFQAPGGATTRKVIYKIFYHYAYPLGDAVEEPSLVSACIEDKNGHILPYVKFEGGTLKLSNEAINVLDFLCK